VTAEQASKRNTPRAVVFPTIATVGGGYFGNGPLASIPCVGLRWFLLPSCGEDSSTRLTRKVRMYVWGRDQGRSVFRRGKLILIGTLYFGVGAAGGSSLLFGV